MTHNHIVAIASIIVLGVSSVWIAWRLRMPSILMLLVAGFLAGPVTGLLKPDLLLGQDLLLAFVSISVALILYEGGLTLSFAELPAVARVVRNLVSIGAAATWVVSALAAWLIFQVSIGVAVLLGAILVVTGPTVIGPVLRHIRPSGRVGPILKWEAIVIDPIGALLAVLVFEALSIEQADRAAAVVAFSIFKTIIIGGGLGLLSAGLLALVIHKFWIPDYLQNAVSLMLVVATHTTSNVFQHESGLFAVTVMGMALANQKRVDVRHIVEFKENLRVLLISFLFIILAARIKLETMEGYWLKGLLFIAVLVLVARPLSVILSTLGSKLNRREKAFIAWMAPRGIVAAAVSSLFALRLESLGRPGAEALIPITFIAIIGTVAIYGLSAAWVAVRLGVADPNPQGILFAGAPTWARALAAVLRERGYSVLLVDRNRRNVAAARMAGLPIYAGSILTEHGLREFELGGIGRLFAVTSNDWINTLAVQRFASIFGRANCYQLVPQQEQPGKEETHKHLHGRWLFGRQVKGAELSERLVRGEVIKATPLSETFTMDDFRKLYGEDAVPMLLVGADGDIRVVTADKPIEASPGQTIISLVEEPPDEAKESVRKEQKQKSANVED